MLTAFKKNFINDYKWGDLITESGERLRFKYSDLSTTNFNEVQIFQNVDAINIDKEIRTQSELRFRPGLKVILGSGDKYNITSVYKQENIDDDVNLYNIETTSTTYIALNKLSGVNK